MKIVRPPDNVVAVIQATRQEYQEFLEVSAAGGMTLPMNDYSWYWISPTGLAYLFVLPQIGEAAKPQEAQT